MGGPSTKIVRAQDTATLRFVEIQSLAESEGRASLNRDKRGDKEFGLHEWCGDGGARAAYRRFWSPRRP